MLIQNGELVTGTLCKKTLGASQGSLIHIIWNEEGPEAARAFLSQTQFVVNYWLLQHGMSIGIGDTVANADTMMKITNIIAGVTPRPPCSCLHATNHLRTPHQEDVGLSAAPQTAHGTVALSTSLDTLCLCICPACMIS